MARDEDGKLDRKQMEKKLYIALIGFYLGSCRKLPKGLTARSDMIIFV